MSSVSGDRASGSKRARRGCHTGWAWLIGLGLASSTAAPAHPQFGPATINRYGRLVLTAPDRARLFYTVMVGDIPALRLRQRADADHNGQLDAAEQAALQAEIAAQVQQGVSLQVGARGTALTWESAQLSLSEAAVSARALAFDAVAVTGPMGPQAAASPWRYQDRVQLAPVGEVELRIEEAPSVWLRGSRGPTAGSPGSPIASPPKAEPLRLFQTFGPAGPDAVFTVELDVGGPAPVQPGPSVPTSHRWPEPLRWLLGGALLLGIALLAARLASRRSA